MKYPLKDRRLGAAVLVATVMLAGVLPNSGVLAQTTSPPAATSAALSEPMIKALQEALNKQGIAVKVDGVLNDETRAAIKKYQSQHHVPVTGEPDKATLDKLGVRQSAALAPSQVLAQATPTAPAGSPSAPGQTPASPAPAAPTQPGQMPGGATMNCPMMQSQMQPMMQMMQGMQGMMQTMQGQSQPGQAQPGQTPAAPAPAAPTQPDQMPSGAAMNCPMMQGQMQAMMQMMQGMQGMMQMMQGQMQPGQMQPGQMQPGQMGPGQMGPGAR